MPYIAKLVMAISDLSLNTRHVRTTYTTVSTSTLSRLPYTGTVCVHTWSVLYHPCTYMSSTVYIITAVSSGRVTSRVLGAGRVRSTGNASYEWR